MHIADRLRIANEFGQQVQMGPERVLELSDRIHNLGHDKPGLIALCKFGRSIQVRRLRTVATKHWNPSDWVAVQAILDEIASLKKDAGQTENILALTVLGVECDGLNAALELLSLKSMDTSVPIEFVPMVNVEAVNAEARLAKRSQTETGKRSK
jgi:hypothetical protein